MLVAQAFAGAAEIPSADPIYNYVHLFVSTILSPQVIVAIIILIILRKPEIVARVTNLDFFGFKVQLADIKQQIAATSQKLNEVDGKLSALQEGYLRRADAIPIDAAARSLDNIARLLKSEARTLENIDFAVRLLTLEAEPGHVLAAAAAIQVRPEPKFFVPLVDFISKLAGTANLNGIRMKIVYRLVMGLQNITRADNARQEHVITDAQRAQASEALVRLKNHPLCQADFRSAGPRSIVPRIEATQKAIHLEPRSARRAIAVEKSTN